MLHAAKVCKVLLEQRHRIPQNEVTFLKDCDDGLVNFRTNAAVLCCEIDEWNDACDFVLRRGDHRDATFGVGVHPSPRFGREWLIACALSGADLTREHQAALSRATSGVRLSSLTTIRAPSRDNER